MLARPPFNLDKYTPTPPAGSNLSFIGWAQTKQSEHQTWSQSQLDQVTFTGLMPDSQRQNFFYIGDWPQFWAWYGHILTLNANGGHWPGNVTTQHVVSDRNGNIQISVVNAVSHPTRDGYTFLGWSKERKDTGTLSDVDIPTANFTLGSNETYYAVWKKNPVLWFIGNGGTLNGMTEASIVSTCDSRGENCTVSASQLGGVPTPVKNHATFTEWTRKADGSGGTLSLSAAHPMSGDETWYAQFKLITYTVTFDAGQGGRVLELATKDNLGTGEKSDLVVGGAKTPVWRSVPNNTMDPSSFTKHSIVAAEDAGHPFTSQVVYPLNESYEASRGGTYAARSAPTTYTKEGKTHTAYRAFLGWSLTAPSGSASDDASRTLVHFPAGKDPSSETMWAPPAGSTGSVTLYAVYSDKILFDLNDGTPGTNATSTNPSAGTPAFAAYLDGPEGDPRTSGDPEHSDTPFDSETGFPMAHRPGWVFAGWSLIRPGSSQWGGTGYITLTYCYPQSGAGGEGYPANDPDSAPYHWCGTVTGQGSHLASGDHLVWQAQWMPAFYRVKFLDGWEDPANSEKGVTNCTSGSECGAVSGYRVLPTQSISVARDSADDPSLVMPYDPGQPAGTGTSVDTSVLTDLLANQRNIYDNYKITGYIAYQENPGRPHRAPLDWSGYQATWQNHLPGTIQTPGDRYSIPVQRWEEGTDWERLYPGTAYASRPKDGDDLPPLRTVDFYAEFRVNSVHHLPSAGGTAWSLLLMLPLLLLLLMAGAWIARRRGLVPVAPDHQPLHVAPRARHAA